MDHHRGAGGIVLRTADTARPSRLRSRGLFTIWLSNLLLRRDAKFAAEKVEELVAMLTSVDFHLVLVANEVGWGIVPDNVLARQFRDLAGWANQRIAAAASEVVLTVAGIPMTVKKATSCP